MAQEFLAVDGMTIDFVSGNDNGDLTIVTPPSTKKKADGNGVYKNATVVNVSNFENDTVQAGSGAGPFIATSTKNLTEALLDLRDGDQAILSGTGTDKVSGNPAPFTTTIEITDPNQSVWKGE